MSDVAAKPPTERQRWMAAQCLAAGEGLAGAAAFAAIPLAVLRRLNAEDADFQELRDAEIARSALPPDAWARRMELLTRQAIERALADGRVSTVNALLRTGLVFPALAAPPSPHARAAMTNALAALDDEPESDAEEEPRSPGPPPVEADPALEARRLTLLARVQPVLRPSLDRVPLDLLEGYAAATDPDPTAYEAWFAAQPKAPDDPVALGEEDLAAIRHVTRHNPPWLRGDYLGYHRPPVPLSVFAADASGVPATRAAPDPVSAPSAPTETAADALAGLTARVERLLDPDAPRTAEELDLAEAVCAVSWPNWPAYRGPLDLALLRRVLRHLPVDANALHRLGSRELAEACNAAIGPVMAQGP